MIPQFVNVVLGLWVTVAPAVLNYGRPASTSDFIAGPLVASFACIALWEAVRPVRWVNAPLGLWLVVSPWMLGHPPSAAASCVISGLAIVAMSCLGGRIQQRFGGGWSSLWRRSPERPVP
jgi:hypothetical protein